MNSLRNSMEKVSGLRFVVEQLRLCSSPGRLALLETSWASTVHDVCSRLDKVERFVTYFANDKQRKGLEELALILERLHNVAASIEVTRDRRACCSDVDLYELKMLALLEYKVRILSKEHEIEPEPMPSLEKVLGILDPDGERLPSFFIADAFSQDLAKLRKQVESTRDDDERDRLALLCVAEEDKVRKRLTRELGAYADDMSRALGALSLNDVLLAKARWAVEHKCSRPCPLSDGETLFTGLIHPEVKEVLKVANDEFQPVDITFGAYPSLITGANMAGKSVLLASIGLAQALMQYGFYVPAQSADIVLVDEIMVSMGDGQSISSGLSSFGAEMLRLNEIVRAMKGRRNILALVDEPARTTNPIEGCAIVNAMVSLFGKYKVRAIITTHYSDIQAECRRWRVKGFIEERIQCPLEVNRLNKCIDYTLEEDNAGVAPQEAVRIAEILGVDDELLNLCKQSLRTKNDEK